MNACLRLAASRLVNAPFRGQGARLGERSRAVRVLGLALLLIPAGYALDQNAAPAQSQPAAPAGNAGKPAAQAPASAKPAPGAVGAVPQAQSGGQTATGQTDGNFTIRTNVNEVNLIFTVTDKHGRFIQNLPPRSSTLPSRPTYPCGSAS